MAAESESKNPSAPRILIGQVLGGKFEISGVLGEGGTGVVYDAVRTAEKDQVALKVIHPHLLGDRQIRGRFTREASILRRLQGPHLLPILDFGEIPDPLGGAAGLLYLALPKVAGQALDRLLAAEKILPLDRALDIMLEVCDALKNAHSQGVIHRDLKPANVLLEGGKRVIVVDFGMAKIVTGGGTGTTALTVHNMVFGTPEYMAPEQARGDELDARCDVYATGVMLYELLTGSVPFTGQTPLSVLTAHLTVPPPPPSSKNPGRKITPALEAVVLHAIAKDPAARYATAGELAAAIVHARQHPDDVDSVRPGTYRIDGDANSDDAQRPTLPAPVPSNPPSTGRTPTPPRTQSAPPRSVPPPAARGWTVFWVLAAAVSIAVGVWLSLKLN